MRISVSHRSVDSQSKPTAGSPAVPTMTLDTLAAAETATRPEMSIGKSRLLQSPTHRWLERLIPALLCVLMLGQVLLKNQRISQTVDEATHLYASYRVLKCGDFGFGYEHPPLARFVAAAPLMARHLPVNCDLTYRDRDDEAPAAVHWLYRQDWQTTLFLARTFISIFALGACLLVWTVARRMFGFTAAVVATVLFVFEPTVIAHSGLVTTDMAITMMMLLAVYVFYGWAQKPTALRLLWAGIATGLALVAKHSGILVVPMLGTLAVADAYLQRRPRQPWRRMAARNLLALGLVVVVAAGVIWGAYGCHFAARRDGSVLLQESPTDRWNSRKSIFLMLTKTHVLPEAYLAGLGEAVGMAQQNSPWGTFLLGRMRMHGVWYFFLVAMAIKYTAPFLALLVMAAFAAAAVFRQHRREALFLGLPAAIYLLICLLSRMDNGIRHTLPMMALLMILVAAGCLELGRRVRWVRYAVPCLVVLHVASSLHAYPNYLSYANELWGGPANLYKLLPNSDWGEAYKEASKYMALHPGPCWVATEFQNDPRDYGVPCTPFGYWFWNPVPARMHGTVIVSSFALRSFYALPGGRYAPFVDVAPVARLAGSAMVVMKGDFDTHVAAAFTEAIASRKLMSQGHFAAALPPAKLATELLPDFEGHFQYCRALVANDETELAGIECSHARNYLSEGIDEHLLASRLKLAKDIDAGVTEAIKARIATNAGQWETALQHAQQAIELAPWSPTARFEYCRALTASRQFDLAARECSPSRVFAVGAAPSSRSATMKWNQIADPQAEIDLLLYALGQPGN